MKRRRKRSTHRAFVVARSTVADTTPRSSCNSASRIASSASSTTAVSRLDRIDERRARSASQPASRRSSAPRPARSRAVKVPHDADAQTDDVGDGIGDGVATPGSTSTASSSAASATVRANGPAVSWLRAIGTTPRWLTVPIVGLIATTSGSGRADDRAIGVGADGERGEACSHGDGRTARGSAGIAIEDVGIAGLTAEAARTAGRSHGAKVRPLAPVGLAEHDRAGGAQACDDIGIGVPGAGERKRARASRHPIRRVDAGFDRHGHAVQRSDDRAVAGSLVESAGNDLGIGVDLDNGFEARPRIVDAAIRVSTPEVTRNAETLAGGHLGVVPGASARPRRRRWLRPRARQ